MNGAVIVTGGTFGIGKEIAHLLAGRGWPVVAFGLEERQVWSIAGGPIADLQAEADARELPITFCAADVTLEADVSWVVGLVLEKHGRIHALVNNAAVGPPGTILETAPELWNRIHAVNLKGPYLMSRAVIPPMKAAGGGRIVNVESGGGWGKPNMAAYAASKGGLIAFSAALALDHFRDRIAVNTVIPGGGGIVSGMTLARAGGDAERVTANAEGSVAGRTVTGADLAKAVAFLISDDAETISGTIVDVGCFAHQGSSSPLGTD